MRRTTGHFNANNESYNLTWDAHLAAFDNNEVKLFVNIQHLKNIQDKRKPLSMVINTNSFWVRGDRYGAQRVKSLSPGGKSASIFKWTSVCSPHCTSDCTCGIKWAILLLHQAIDWQVCLHELYVLILVIRWVIMHIITVTVYSAV